MHFDDEAIMAMTTDVFTTTLGLDVNPGGDGLFTDPGAAITTSCILLTGDWSGAITLDCSPELARLAASRMFDMPPDELPDDDVNDALGELTNMLGGSLKSLVPGSCQLSLPTVAVGVGLHFSIPRSVVRTDLGLECAGYPLHVTVLERSTS